MRMAVARARNLRALGTGKLPVVQSALVIGGGLAGMTTALALGDQGFAVHLIEKEATLGGQLRHIHYTLEGADVAVGGVALVFQDFVVHLALPYLGVGSFGPV